ncbi:MAG TPA: methylenetetrahydrofolate reductase [Dehalococcoidia bacterium]|nr:methylenetetrahydrofolate reductase [Dehalococcoidia bacterium]
MPAEPVSALDAALRDGRFIVTAELTSPPGADAASLRRRARLLRGHVLAANVPDGQAVSAHMAPLAAARLVLEEGLEPVLTMQCRDRNRLALQSDLIGAAALGVANVLCLTGDTPAEGSPVPAVFDLDSVALMGAATGLMAGRFLDGGALRAPPRLLLGAAAHPFDESRFQRIERLGAKAAAGARFVQTQYIFDVPGFAAWLQELRAAGLGRTPAILASTGPLRSPRVLGFIRRLPGVRLPAAIEQRLAGLSDTAFAEESLAICAETAAALAALPGVAGIHLLAPYWEQRIPEIIAAAGLAGRTARA